MGSDKILLSWCKLYIEVKCRSQCLSLFLSLLHAHAYLLTNPSNPSPPPHPPPPRLHHRLTYQSDLVRAFHQSDEYDEKNGYYTVGASMDYDWTRYHADLKRFRDKRAKKSLTAQMVRSAMFELADLRIFEDAVHFRLTERITLILKANASRWLDHNKWK